jgi:hypothetical protein
MRALLRLQQLGCRPTMRAPLWQTMLRGFSSSDAKLPAVVHPAEARAVRVLTAVLTTLLTPLHQPSNIKDECHRETFDGPERRAGETVLAYADRALKANIARNLDGKGAGSALTLHSHPWRLGVEIHVPSTPSTRCHVHFHAIDAPQVARETARRPQAVQRGTGDRRARWS